MKSFLKGLIIFMLMACPTALAVGQGTIKPNLPAPAPVSKPAPKPVTVPKATTAAPVKEVANYPTIKFTSNASCTLYIDGELIGTIQSDGILKRSLKPGEYQFKVVSTSNQQDILKEYYTVEDGDPDSFYDFDLLSIIEERHKKEAEAKSMTELEKSKYILTDEFVDNALGWFTTTDADKQQNIKNGKYEINGLNNYCFQSNIKTSLDTEKDFTFSINVKWVSGVDNNSFGINYCSDINSDLYFAFLISSDGSYRISYWENKSWHDIKPWTTSNFINQGAYINNLKVQKKGSRMYFYINDTEVINLPDEGSFGNYFGIRSCDVQTVRFDDFRLEGFRED